MIGSPDRKSLGEIVFIAPMIHREHRRHVPPRRSQLRFYQGNLLIKDIRFEGIHCPVARVGDHHEIVRFVEDKLNGFDRTIAHDLHSSLLRKRTIDALPMRIDKIELAGAVYRCARDVVEAPCQPLDPRARRRDRGGWVTSFRTGIIVGTIDRQCREFAISDELLPDSVDNHRIVEGDLVVPVNMNIPESNVF